MLAVAILIGWTVASAGPQPPGNAARSDDGAPAKAPGASEEKPPEWPLKPKPSWTRVARDFPLWVDLKHKQVIVGGHIALRRGQLEMFACPRGTKEHESVVAVHAPARFVHAALLAAGAKPGHPVRFEPKYVPATGTVVDVEVIWRDKSGKVKKVRAQELVKNVRTGKAMTGHWVFGGSGFWTDKETGKRYYYADGGELICLSNFATATLDLPIRSSAANSALLFRAFTERIPPRRTPVLLVL
ncbi:MAG TPA: hypothetical protein ENJ62_07880, partial [Bryobacterales bacterium]|nr:hypothetical protein [Bryobacterales bacterium]